MAYWEFKVMLVEMVCNGIVMNPPDMDGLSSEIWNYGVRSGRLQDKTRDEGAKPGLVQWGSKSTVPTHLYTLSMSIGYKSDTCKMVK